MNPMLIVADLDGTIFDTYRKWYDLFLNSEFNTLLEDEIISYDDLLKQYQHIDSFFKQSSCWESWCEFCKENAGNVDSYTTKFVEGFEKWYDTEVFFGGVDFIFYTARLDPKVQEYTQQVAAQLFDDIEVKFCTNYEFCTNEKYDFCVEMLRWYDEVVIIDDNIKLLKLHIDRKEDISVINLREFCEIDNREYQNTPFKYCISDWGGLW